MLTMVPDAINRMTRTVVINHPNTFNCVVIRQTVTRPSGSSVGGLPTLGGLAVISADDEEQVEWNSLGKGFAMKSEPFQASLMMDRQDANNGAAEEFRFLIEPETIGAFEPKKEDVFYLVYNNLSVGGVTVKAHVAYEIVGVETTSDIPPFTQRYICNRRNDLMDIVV